MRQASRLLATGLAALGLAACAVHGTPLRSPGGSPVSGVSGTVLDADDIAAFGTVIEALYGRVPNMRIQRGDGCPALSLRRANAPTPFSQPVICVDGVRTIDTCALQELSIHDVARISVYPVTAPRVAACQPGANGLIVLTMKGR